MKSINLKTQLFILFTLLTGAAVYSQTEGVSIKTHAGAPDASAMLDIDNNTKGLLIPRVSFTNVAQGSPVNNPATGLLVFNPGVGSILKGFYFWNGSAWEKLSTGPNHWSNYSTGTNIYNTAGSKVVIGVPSANPTYNFEVLTPATTETASTKFHSKSGAELRFGYHDDMMGVDDGSILTHVSGHAYAGGTQNGPIRYAQVSSTSTYTNFGIDLFTLPKTTGTQGGCYISGNYNELFINSHVLTAYSASTGGYVELKNTGWIPISDSTLKRDIRPESPVLNIITQLNPVTYRFKKEGPNGPITHGFLAQELQAKLPGVVSTLSVPDGPVDPNSPQSLTRTQKLGVNYTALVSVLVKAIQEQQVQIDSLKVKVSNLEKR